MWHACVVTCEGGRGSESHSRGRFETYMRTLGTTILRLQYCSPHTATGTTWHDRGTTRHDLFTYELFGITTTIHLLEFLPYTSIAYYHGTYLILPWLHHSNKAPVSPHLFCSRCSALGGGLGPAVTCAALGRGAVARPTVPSHLWQRPLLGAPRVLQTAFFRTRNGRSRSADARCHVAFRSHGSGWRRCGPAAAALIATDWMA